jgi:hypothetical protein
MQRDSGRIVKLPAGTVTRVQWSARPRNHTPRRLLPLHRPGVELHHSVGLYGAATAGAWARSMQADHLGRPGWADVWYALGIWTDGTPVELRGVDWRSAPTDHLTVCLAGNYDQRVPTADQWSTLTVIRQNLVAAGGGDRLGWHGQRAAVSCPGRHAIARARASQTLLPPDLKDDDMTPEQARQLANIESLLARHLDEDARSRRPSLWRDMDVTKQAVGRIETRLGGLSASGLSNSEVKELAAQIASSMDDRCAKAVADELARRLRD